MNRKSECQYDFDSLLQLLFGWRLANPPFNVQLWGHEARIRFFRKIVKLELRCQNGAINRTGRGWLQPDQGHRKGFKPLAWVGNCGHCDVPGAPSHSREQNLLVPIDLLASANELLNCS